MSKDKRNFRLKMHAACGTDELRPIMQHVYFDNGFMIATDAHVLIKAAIQRFSDFDKSEVDMLNGKLLHKSTFKKILSCEQVVVTENGIQDLATKDVYAFAQMDMKFPNYNAVIPGERGPVNRVGINPKVASKLLTVLNTPEFINIELNFTQENRAIVIKPIGEENESLTAILMPVLLSA